MMPFKLTIFFSERSARIAHAAAAYFHSRKIKLSCDVGFKVFIWYDSATKTFVNEDDPSRIRFRGIVKLLRRVLGHEDFDVLYITSIYGIKLCDFDEFGDANTVLHSCFRHYANAVIKKQRSTIVAEMRSALQPLEPLDQYRSLCLTSASPTSGVEPTFIKSLQHLLQCSLTGGHVALIFITRRTLCKIRFPFV